MERKLQITLTAARVNAGYSLDEVAKEMKKTKGTIINWEKGRTSMKITEFEDLCKLYNIAKDYIILPTTLQKVE
jgi:transcriptional regulator with XRE-family HTH domain